MAMDLEGVRRKLTEGYARINKVKNSTTKIEACRTMLKSKGEKAVSDVKTMMSCIAQKLYQLQQSIESTIENTVAEREMQLDAKKKEIHDGYANLVRICVEADNVLRGRNVDLLGRSCQRLFCKFEAANLKLDAAEKVDTGGLIGFEFKDDSKQFLSNTHVARLQHFNRYGRLAEIDEFWLDYQNTDDFLDAKNETTYMVSMPCSTDCSDIWPATVRRSPERSTSFSPKQCLETIQEVPEDNSPMKADKNNVKTEVHTPAEVVRICEEDLYKCHCCSDSGMNSSYLLEPEFVPPPPGFPRLKEPGLEMNLQQYAHLQKKLGFTVNPKWGISRNMQVANSAHCTNTTNSCVAGEVSSEVSRSDASFADGVQNESNSARFQPVRSQPVSSQNSEMNPKFTRDRVLNKPPERHRDMEDFVWDSDDSLELLSAGTCSSYHGEVGTLGHCTEESKGTKSNGTSSPQYFSRVNPTVVKTEVEVKTPCSESDDEDEYKRAFSSMSSLSSNGQYSAETLGDSLNIGSGREQNTHCYKWKQNGCVQKDVTLKDIKKETAEPKQNGYIQKDLTSRDMAEPKANGYVQKDFTSRDIKKEMTEPKQNGNIPKDLSLKDTCIKKEKAEPKLNGCAENDLTRRGMKKEMAQVVEKKRSVVIHVDVQKEDGASVRTVEAYSPGKKPTASSIDTSKDQEGLAKTIEVPRPVKTKSKRLDLTHMLQHTQDGFFVIHAKCIEKIRGDFSHPIGVCTNSKGDVIVADTCNHIIKVCNNGRVVKKFGSDLKMRRPSAVVVNEKDEIFVKDDICLYHFDAEGQFIKTMGKRMMNAPYGLGLTKEGKLIVVDALYSNGRMHAFQQDGSLDTYPYQPLHDRHEDSKCRFLAVHGDNVLTSDLGRSCLYLTNQRGELSKTLGWRGRRFGELNEPAGVAADSMGNWIVADSKNHRVQVFDENGYFMAALHFTGESIRRPSGIHLTNDGLLYIINYVESVIKVFKLGAS